MTNDEVKDDLIELEHCNLVCLVSDDDDDDDIYIMVKCLFVCMFVTKNHHFFLLVSCNHLNHP